MSVHARRLCILLLTLVVAGCGDDADDPPAEPDTPPRASDTPRNDPTAPRVPLFELRDGRGEPFGVEQLAGRVWLAVFVDGKDGAADDARLTAVETLAAATADAEPGKRAQMVVFLADTTEEEHAALRKVVEKHELDPAGITALMGRPGEVALIRAEGFGASAWWSTHMTGGAKPNPDDVFLVDRYGIIRGRMDIRAEGGVAAAQAALKPLVGERAPTRTAFPEGSLEPTWLGPRARAQVEASKSWTVLHDFRFEDRRRESGIDFMHRCVDDSGRDYKPVHYDHGSGVAIADVDGDGLYDVYFSNQVGSNQLWRNLGGGRFEDITARAGVAFRDPCGVTASFADTDNDGDPDLFVTSVRHGNALFVNDGTGKFEDVTAKSGLAYEGHSSAGVFFDYDKDGLLDLFLCNVGVYTNDVSRVVSDDSTTSGLEPGPFEYYDGFPDAFSGHLKKERLEASILYRNLGKNRFEDVTEAMGIVDTSWTGDASPIDMNDDGWIDLYVLNMQGHDEYYENVGGKKFVKRSREIFPKTPWGSMGVKVFDFDLDGRLDLYLTDMHSDMSVRVGPDEEKLKSNMTWPESLLVSGGMSIFGNAFFHKTGPDEVVEVSDAIGAENYWPWGFSVGDLNADGYEDAFVASSMNYFYRYGVNSVLLNDAGRKFLDAEFVLGVEPRRGPLFKPWFELDCMDIDDRMHPMCKETDYGVLVAWAPLGSRSSVIFDLDGDGDLDVITNDLNSEPLVLISDLAARHAVKFLKVRLVGTKSNRDGLGSLVRVHAGGKVYLKVHDGQSGYLSQSSQLLYFGLGGAAKVDRVEVTWPSGKKQVVTAPASNAVLEITEE